MVFASSTSCSLKLKLEYDSTRRCDFQPPNEATPRRQETATRLAVIAAFETAVLIRRIHSYAAVFDSLLAVKDEYFPIRP
jgi:hypothetical protein